MRRLRFFLAIMAWATSAQAATYLNIGGDKGLLASQAGAQQVPIGGGGNNSNPEYIIRFLYTNNGCAVYQIPALPQTLPQTPSLNCVIYGRNPAPILDTSNSITWTIAFLAFQYGSNRPDFWNGTLATQFSQAPSAFNQNDVFAIGEIFNIPIENAGTHSACQLANCHDAPTTMRLCRTGGTNLDSIDILSIVCSDQQ